MTSMATFCPKCGSKLEGIGMFCQNCGAPKTSRSGNPDSVERVFLENTNGVTVTNTRLVTPNRTYALANVSSIKIAVDKPRRFWAILALVLFSPTLLSGLIFLATETDRNMSTPMVMMGGIPVGLAIWWLTSRRSQYVVVLHASGGESEAVFTRDRQFAQLVIDRVSDAIIARG
jgi:hypothetical protein